MGATSTKPSDSSSTTDTTSSINFGGLDVVLVALKEGADGVNVDESNNELWNRLWSSAVAVNKLGREVLAEKLSPLVIRLHTSYFTFPNFEY